MSLTDLICDPSHQDLEDRLSDSEEWIERLAGGLVLLIDAGTRENLQAAIRHAENLLHDVEERDNPLAFVRELAHRSASSEVEKPKPAPAPSVKPPPTPAAVEDTAPPEPLPPETLVCRSCGVEKPVSEMNRNQRGPIRRCKACWQKQLKAGIARRKAAEAGGTVAPRAPERSDIAETYVPREPTADEAEEALHGAMTRAEPDPAEVDDWREILDEAAEREKRNEDPVTPPPPQGKKPMVKESSDQPPPVVKGDRFVLVCATHGPLETVVAPDEDWLNAERVLQSALHGCPVTARPIEETFRSGAHPTKRHHTTAQAPPTGKAIA